MTTSLSSARPDQETLNAFQQDLDAIRDEALARRGQHDANYIRNIIRIQRGCEIAGRVVLVAGFIPPLLSVWWLFLLAGIALLSLAKILDNMEIGHNEMHGQYDWMNDPHIN